MFSRLKERLTYLFYHVQYDWQIGFAHTDPEALLQGNLGKLHWLKQPISSFWADPFFVYDGNNLVLFLEDYIKEKGYGNISYIVFDSKRNEVEHGIAIDEGLHFSFPNVFNHDGTYYMLPEAASKGYLALYKCVSFPSKWVEEKVVLSEPCADAIFHFSNGKWYLLYSKDDENRNQNLYLRSCEDLFGDWGLQTETLVKSDISNARCAGNIFEMNGQLYRPSQNCTDFYGQSVVLNKVLEIGDGIFSETPVLEIKGPPECEKGFHSFCYVDGTIAIDGRVKKLQAKGFKEIIQSFRKKSLKKRQY